MIKLLNEIGAATQTTTKLALLRSELSNTLLREVFHAAYNPFVTYGIKKIPPDVSSTLPMMTLRQAVQSLRSQLATRVYTGRNAIQHLQLLRAALSPDDREVLDRILLRDLRCGVDRATFNKVFVDDPIPVSEVCLASPNIDAITYPAIAQTKMDGARAHLYFDGAQARALSRSGKEFLLHDSFNEAASSVMIPSEIFDGELVFRGEGQDLLDRKTSNGLANKAIKGTLTKEESLRAVFFCWDIVDQTSTIPYMKRLETLRSRNFSDGGKKRPIRIVTTDIARNKAHAMSLYQDRIHDGQEGIILKNLDFKWAPKRVKGMGKIKAEHECELKVVEWVEGQGKYVGMLGKLICESSDGMLVVGVGSGFSDAERIELTPENTLGRILTVRYNAVTKDVSSGVTSLFLPRFIEFRDAEKNQADSLQTIMDI